MNENTLDNTSAAGEPPAEVQRLEFRGNAGEYFRIWIVNVVLTIVTFGIYSAWAKVRTRRYFYGNTFLAGAAFDYHADPVKILKGRLLVAIPVLGYALGGKISIYISLASGLLLLAIFPWMTVRSLSFNLRNSSYRNIHFGFTGRTRDAYATYFKGLFATMLTLGLAFPYAYYLHARFRITNIRFGSARFGFEGRDMMFFGLFVRTLIVYIGGVLIGLVVAVLLGIVAKTVGGEEGTLAVFMKGLAGAIGIFALYGILLYAAALLRGEVFNRLAQSTSLASLRFGGTLWVNSLFGLYLTNLIACFLTLGLAFPWAMVRLLRYRYENTQVIGPAGAFDGFVAGAREAEGSAAADAAVDFFDIDLGL